MDHTLAGGLFFFSSRRRHTRFKCDWSSDVCSSDLLLRDRRALLRTGRLEATEAPKLPGGSNVAKLVSGVRREVDVRADHRTSIVFFTTCCSALWVTDAQ